MCDKHWIKWTCINCHANLPTTYWKDECGRKNCNKIKTHEVSEMKPLGYTDSCKNARCQTKEALANSRAIMDAQKAALYGQAYTPYSGAYP
nr:uncharacterized protein CTRU02_13360 [Colletotrichum truncatum]KAF6783370.1 hypothetical protein CTRU02_13360 [Colletotrichum truncatum]